MAEPALTEEELMQKHKKERKELQGIQEFTVFFSLPLSYLNKFFCSFRFPI